MVGMVIIWIYIGSGTILIEAAMIACNIPQILCERIWFEKINWDVDLFEKIEGMH